MVYFVRYVTNSLFFDVLLLYCYINLRSSAIFCLSAGDIHLSLGVSLLPSFLTISEFFCCEVFETFVILPTVLLPIKAPITYFCCFLFFSFWSSSWCICLRFFSMMKKFMAESTNLSFYLYFYQYFYVYF